MSSVVSRDGTTARYCLLVEKAVNLSSITEPSLFLGNFYIDNGVYGVGDYASKLEVFKIARKRRVGSPLGLPRGNALPLTVQEGALLRFGLEMRNVCLWSDIYQIDLF